LKLAAYFFFVISTQLSGHHSPSDSIMATSDDFRVPLIPAGAVVSQEATNVPSVDPSVSAAENRKLSGASEKRPDLSI
jgi:hypothetical protein